MNAQCDLARLDGALDTEAHDAERRWAAAHLRSCAACRLYADRRAALDARLRALPAEILPVRSLWQSIQGRINTFTGGAEQLHDIQVPQKHGTAASRLHTWNASRVWRTAAAIALFTSGYVVGTSRERSQRPPDRALPMEAPSTSSNPTQAAAEVQRLGSAWTASLARLARHDAVSATVTTQEREVALSTIRGAAAELMRITPDKAGVAAAYTAIVEDQRNHGAETPRSRRVTF